MSNNWQKQVKMLLKLPATLIGSATSLASSATAIADESAAASNMGHGMPQEPVTLPNTLNEISEDKYAAHRSHSSHRSHRSHRSSSGGSRTPAPAPKTTAPPPNRQTTPPQATDPSEPSSTKGSIPKPTAGDLSVMTIRVQAALMRLGYYNGDIDGILGPSTRASLIQYQKAKNLSPTGRIDIDTLTHLGISIP